MIPSVRQSSTTSAQIVIGGYYCSFRLPVEKRLMRGLERTEVRTVRSRPGENVSMPPRLYRYARKVAHAAILSHRAAMYLPPPPKVPWRRPVQLRLVLY